MGSRRGRIALGAASCCAVALTANASSAPLRVLIGHTPNKTWSNRSARTIDGIVIHATEGRFVGSVRWLESWRADGSAHFVVSRRGQIVQLVPTHDVAWHSGNRRWNLHSIGIEHEGWARRGGFTEKEYRASAQLVAYLAHRWSIPLDRKHVIGHSEVPNPVRPGHFGGIDGHTDPGRHWRWAHYMALVRHFTRHPSPPRFVRRMTLHDSIPPRAVRVAPARTSGGTTRHVVTPHAKLSGNALWWSGIDAVERWRRHIYKVDFIVDGRILYTDHSWPFSFHRGVGWNTRTVADGRHLLVVRAFGTHRYRQRKRVPVRVVNPPIGIALSGVGGPTVSGSVKLHVAAEEPVRGIALYVDGKPVSRDAVAPYRLTWDTTRSAEGPHTVLVYVRGKHGRRGAESMPLIVANSPSFPQALSRSWPARLVPVDG